MRKAYGPTVEMQASYDAAYAEYQDRLTEYEALAWYQKLFKSKPRWNAVQPGYYDVTVKHYLDGRWTSDQPNKVFGDWALTKEFHVQVNDYSPAWYAEQREAEYRAERAAYERQQQEREYASSVWRANAGNAYYDNNNPWAYQRDPGRWG